MPIAPITRINPAGTAAGTATGAAAGTAASSSAASSAAASRAASLLDRDAFLKLLVAQLKYQDPSKPVDASEMISQSAQLSVVDKLDQISTALVESSATNRLTLGGSIIGKQITFPGTDGYIVSATVTSVSFDGSSMVLRAGAWDVPIDSVRSIAAAATTPA